MNDPVYRPVISAVRTLFFVQGTRFTITGAEHVPKVGGAVMAINHTSYLDFMYAGLPAWPQRRYVRFMAKTSIFSHKVTGPLMRGMKHIPVDRHRGGEAFAAAIRSLRAGEIVGVFPEATMSRSFELKEFKPGAVKMAQVAGVPVLPTTIWGGQRVWTKNLPKHMRPLSGIPVSITVGEPIEIGRRETSPRPPSGSRRRCRPSSTPSRPPTRRSTATTCATCRRASAAPPRRSRPRPRPTLTTCHARRDKFTG